MVVSPVLTCATQPVTLTWETTQSYATVDIEGVGTNLPPRGSMQITDGRRTFTGVARNSCVVGPAASAVALVRPPVFVSVVGPGFLQQHSTGGVFIFTTSDAMWTASSFNPTVPSAGVGPGSATYIATNFGADSIVVTARGVCGDVAFGASSVFINRSPFLVGEEPR